MTARNVLRRITRTNFITIIEPTEKADGENNRHELGERPTEIFVSEYSLFYKIKKDVLNGHLLTDRIAPSLPPL